MTGDEYRVKAADILALAKQEISLDTRVELEGLALAYLRLADQADRNALTDNPTTQPIQQQPEQQQQQQQQQQQVKSDE